MFVTTVTIALKKAVATQPA